MLIPRAPIYFSGLRRLHESMPIAYFLKFLSIRLQTSVEDENHQLYNGVYKNSIKSTSISEEEEKEEERREGEKEVRGGTAIDG